MGKCNRNSGQLKFRQERDRCCREDMLAGLFRLEDEHLEARAKAEREWKEYMEDLGEMRDILSLRGEL